MNFKNLNEAFENKFSVSRSLLREEREQEKSRQLSKKRFLESIDRTLTEKHWKFTIPGTFRNAIFDAGDEEDYEGVRQALVSICEYVVDNIKESEFDVDEQEEIAEEFADFIEELEYMDFEDEDEANYYLNDLYDLLDNTDIFLGLRESLNERDKKSFNESVEVADFGEEPYLYFDEIEGLDAVEDFEGGIVGAPQNLGDAPFKRFSDIDMYYYATANGEDVGDLSSEVPRNIKSQFVKACNNYASDHPVSKAEKEEDEWSDEGEYVLFWVEGLHDRASFNDVLDEFYKLKERIKDLDDREEAVLQVIDFCDEYDLNDSYPFLPETIDTPSTNRDKLRQILYKAFPFPYLNTWVKDKHSDRVETYQCSNDYGLPHAILKFDSEEDAIRCFKDKCGEDRKRWDEYDYRVDVCVARVPRSATKKNMANDRNCEELWGLGTVFFRNYEMKNESLREAVEDEDLAETYRLAIIDWLYDHDQTRKDIEARIGVGIEYLSLLGLKAIISEYDQLARDFEAYFNDSLDESLTEDISQVKIPAPYNKYFRIATDATLEDEGWTYGEEVEGQGCHILALLEPKRKAVEDIYPILVDDPDYPVCEIEAGRLYPVEIPSMDESLNESNEEKPNANQFEAYVLIQKSGITNMFDVDTIEDVANAILEVYLDKANCLYIYKHYNELMDEYKDQIDVSDSKVAEFMDQYEDIYYDDYDDYDECLNESDGQIDSAIKEKVIKKFNQEIAKSDIDHSIDEDGYGFHITRKDGSKLSYDASTGKFEFIPAKKLGEGKVTGGSMPPKDVALIRPLIDDLDRIEDTNKDGFFITWNFGRRLSDDRMTAGIDVSVYKNWEGSEEDLNIQLEALEDAIKKNGFTFDDSLGYDSEHWRKHAFGNGYHTQIIETAEEVVEESFGYKPSFDEWYFQETGVNTSDLTDEQYDELWADEDLMNHYRKFCDDLDESLNEEYEEVDISDYKYVGNVDGFSTYRKVITDENGKMRGIWAAQDQDEKEPPFRITYDQALGYEPIKDTHGIKRLSRDLGRLLLPQDESLNEEYEEEDDVLTLYHGTNKELSNIDFLSSKELGLHAGTLEQAQNKGKIIYQIDVDKNTPTLNLHDDLTSGYFSSPEFLILLKNNNIIGDMDFENLYQTLRLYSGEDGENKYKGYSEAYRNFLLNKGFKLIKYPNKAEGSGYSYIILDDSIIKSIKNIGEKPESSESLNEEYLYRSMDALHELDREIEDYLNQNNFHGFIDLYDISPNDEPVPSITYHINGDWKHEHLRFKYLVKEFLNSKNIVHMITEREYPSDSDSYEADYTIHLMKHEDDVDECLNESLPKEIKKDIDRIVKTHGAHNIPKWQIQSIAQDNPNYSKEIWGYVSDLECPDNGINEQLESGYYPSEWDTDFEDELENLEIEPQRGVYVGYQYRVPNRRLASKMVKLAKDFGYDDSWVEGNTLYLKWSRPEKEYHKSPYDECLTEERKPKYWNSVFAKKVIDAYEKGDLTFDNIKEWDKNYNGGIAPNPPFNTGEILKYYLNHSKNLSEDTVKQNGKWVNKGKEGTHGTFKTKKEADAQRKAMFASGFKG